MFAGRRRQSSNIRAMQLFHELKQQFPTVPDHIVNSHIQQLLTPTSTSPTPQPPTATAAENAPKPMGHSPTGAPTSHPTMHQIDTGAIYPSESVAYSRSNETVVVTPPPPPPPSQSSQKYGNSEFYVKRPNCLKLNSERNCNLQLSKKNQNVPQLLNSTLSDKPPRSPQTNKKSLIKQQQQQQRGVETASTPTQTTDTLIAPSGGGGGGGGVNLQLNVNCSMDLSPTARPRQTTMLHVTPQQPWLNSGGGGGNGQVIGVNGGEPRSYTSVNLMLRTPSTEPQPPIDITSQNSSLTYSTSSFDRAKGLESRLQITVGGTGGSVASMRTRARSCYLMEDEEDGGVKGGMRKGGSLNDLSICGGKPQVYQEQQVRLERLRIALRTEKTNLEVMQVEVGNLEKNPSAITKVDDELEKQLKREIDHLRFQCEQLVHEAEKIPINENGDFYQNIYTGQRGRLMTSTRWSCSMCTFLNHPQLDECEQCTMARILHVSAAPGDNIHIHVTPRLSRRIVRSWVI